MVFNLLIFFFLVDTFRAEYVVNIERAELSFFNKTLIKDMVFQFGKYNRTTVALNFSFILLRDFPDAKIKVTISGDQFFHNEYRYSGQNFTLNACNLWKANLFHTTDLFKKAGWMMDACNMKKGPYKLSNFVLDPQYFPKYLLFGRWRINVKCHHEDVGDLLFVRWYLEINPRKAT